jgi:nicotinate-nucleotide adenylyltransferase
MDGGCIAIFGGSFDPVHKGHIEIAKLACLSFDLQKVIFVPAWAAPHKLLHFASPESRLALLKIALSDFSDFAIDLFEFEKKDKVYTYQTLDYFQNKYPSSRIQMIIGSDSLNALCAWKNIDYIVSKYEFIVAKREGVSISADGKMLRHCIFIDKEIPEISSSNIRRLIEQGDPQAALFLDPKVYEYIIKNKIYAG